MHFCLQQKLHNVLCKIKPKNITFSMKQTQFHRNVSHCYQVLDVSQFPQATAPVKPTADLVSVKAAVAKLTLDDDIEKEVNDLSVIVDNPEKHVTAMESYITFRVITKVIPRVPTVFSSMYKYNFFISKNTYNILL